MQITVGNKIVILLLFFPRVKNLVSHIEERTHVEGKRENDSEQHICRKDGGNKMNLEKVA
jgi:hypothetical protein